MIFNKTFALLSYTAYPNTFYVRLKATSSSHILYPDTVAFPSGLWKHPLQATVSQPIRMVFVLPDVTESVNLSINVGAYGHTETGTYPSPVISTYINNSLLGVSDKNNIPASIDTFTFSQNPKEVTTLTLEIDTYNNLIASQSGVPYPELGIYLSLIATSVSTSTEVYRVEPVPSNNGIPTYSFEQLDSFVVHGNIISDFNTGNNTNRCVLTVYDGIIPSKNVIQSALDTEGDKILAGNNLISFTNNVLLHSVVSDNTVISVNCNSPNRVNGLDINFKNFDRLNFVTSGTAGWFLLNCIGGDVTSDFAISGTIGLSGTDAIINNVNIVSGKDYFFLNSLTLDVLELL